MISSNRDMHPWPIPPIGACYVASSLERAGFDVQLLDILFTETPSSVITEKICQFMPDMIAVSIRNIDNLDLQYSHFYLDDVKENVIYPVKRATSAPLVIGGAAVSIMPEMIMDFLDVDYAVCGEGEETMIQFARHLQSNSDISHIDGLIYRNDGGVIRNPVERIEDLDELALPRVYRWVGWKKYRLNYAPYPVQTKRGCALTCSYCVYNRIEGCHYRLRDPEKVVDEIEDIIENCKPQVIEFTDSTFNIPLEHAMEICREIIKRRIKVSFNTMGINPGAVTEELVALMKEANFMEVSCTPESGSERMLKALGKNFTLKHVERSARFLSKAGIPVVWYFLFGGQGEDETTVMETFSFIEENIAKRDLVFITSGIRVLPGSPVYTYAREIGQLSGSTDILRPIWFQPESINMKTMLYMINREVITHGNYINLQDNTDKSVLARILKRVYSFLGLKEPIWNNVMRRDCIFKISGYNKYRLWKLETEYREYS
jgi:radical SAM superfamily enzyme YgiQ (UPF0313 family)